MMIKMDKKKIRKMIGPYFPLMIFLFVMIIILYGINLVFVGRQFYSVYLSVSLGIGMILLYYSKTTYYGSLLMTITSIYIIFLALINVYFDIKYFYQLLLSAFFSLILLPLHYFSKDIVLLRRSIKTLYFPNLSYIVTALFILVIFNYTNLLNFNVYMLVLCFIIFLLLTILNRSYREYKINSIFNISNLTVFDEIYEDLELDFQLYKEQMEVILSEFSNSIFSYIDGIYDRTIEDDFRCLEGLDRLLKWGKNESLKHSIFKEKYKEISLWRNKLAHSKVRKKGKNEEYFKADENKAFISIDMTREILMYYARERAEDIAHFLRFSYED